MFALRCPSCSNNTFLSLADSGYEGPFRCWRCKGLFMVKIENEELKSCKPMTEDELERLQEAESLES